MIAELQSNIDQTLMRAEAQKEKHKRMYPFAKETFVSKKRRVKENKAKARKRRRERAEKKTRNEIICNQTVLLPFLSPRPGPRPSRLIAG